MSVYRLAGYAGNVVHMLGNKSEQVMFSQIIPGNTLTVDGAFITYLMDGNCLAGTDIRLLRVKINNHVVNQVQLADDVTNWRLGGELVRMNVSAFKCSKFGGSLHGGNPGYNGKVYVSQGYIENDLVGFDWTQDVEFSFTVQNSSNAVADFVTGNTFLMTVWN